MYNQTRHPELNKTTSQGERDISKISNVIGDKVESSFARAKENLHHASETAKKMSTQVSGFVRKNPWLALSTAIGTGILLGRLFARKNPAEQEAL